ncbi:MAG: reverse transcriptase family protein [Desulfobacula sp.]|nr:reverse transcriptase family protein [Desulfobacula sp.]
MCSWCPQQFRKEGLINNVDPNILEHAIQNAELVSAVNSKLPPIFSLKHLSHLTNVDYALLRSVVERKQTEPYKVFRLNKRGKKHQKRGFRIICIPDPFLMDVQRWISKKILSCGSVHSASFAYAENCKIMTAATLHRKCRWMLKLDVKNFFESFSEISAYRVFRSFGYQPLISFELSRLCTRLGEPTLNRTRPKWLANKKKYKVISNYTNRRMGHLPQGAPTSPMLSNLAMKEFDGEIAEIAQKNNLVYSRYADDLCLSTTDKQFNRNKAKKVIRSIYIKMREIGLAPNITKTQIITPGARKIVLGLLVDGGTPKLSREFRSKLRMHFYYLKHVNIGPALHAKNREFDSVLGLKNHIEGLISYAKQIDPEYASHCYEQINSIEWPL